MSFVCVFHIFWLIKSPVMLFFGHRPFAREWKKEVFLLSCSNHYDRARWYQYISFAFSKLSSSLLAEIKFWMSVLERYGLRHILMKSLSWLIRSLDFIRLFICQEDRNRLMSSSLVNDEREWLDQISLIREDTSGLSAQQFSKRKRLLEWLDRRARVGLVSSKIGQWSERA